MYLNFSFFFFSSRRRHTRSLCDWSSDVCSSDLLAAEQRETEKQRWIAVQNYEMSRKQAFEIIELIEVSEPELAAEPADRKSTRLNSSHTVISYAVFCLKKKRTKIIHL